ncbi:hypothetical protein ACFFLS_10480 [Flavobacterium procerum]|uniref:DUF4595 domain-containing protein n=1 Tax=Flavobacterium procerum TaxID=1455569 RepID=A0ABV6BPS0_9FLAO
MNKLLLLALMLSNLSSAQINEIREIEIYPEIITSDVLFKANVKEVVSESFSYGDNKEKYEGISTWKYNKDKQLTEYTAHFGDSRFKTMYTYKDRLLVNVIKYEEEEGSTKFKKTEYLYNSKKALEKMTETDSDGNMIRMRKFEYKNESIYPFKIEEFDIPVFSDKISFKGYNLLEYDENQSIIKNERYSESDKPAWFSQSKYNGKFLIEKELLGNTNEQNNSRISYKRDERNRIIEKFLRGVLVSKDYYEGDLLIKYEEYRRDKVDVIVEYAYNKYRDIIMKSVKNVSEGTKNVEVYTIKSDALGNQLEMKLEENGELVSSLKNKFVYY